MKSFQWIAMIPLVALSLLMGAAPLSGGEKGKDEPREHVPMPSSLKVVDCGGEDFVGLPLGVEVIRFPVCLDPKQWVGGGKNIISAKPDLNIIVTGGQHLDSVVRLLKGKHFIGVECSPASHVLRAQLKLGEGIGLVVDRVLKSSPAAEAGIKKNDVLVKADDTELGTRDDLLRTIEKAAGKSVTLTLIRGGKQQAAVVTPKDSEPFYANVVPAQIAEVIKKAVKANTPYIVLHDAEKGEYTVFLLRRGIAERPEDRTQRTEEVLGGVIWYVAGVLNQLERDLEALKGSGGTYVRPAADESLEDRVQRVERVVEAVFQYSEEMLDRTGRDLKALKGTGGYVIANLAEALKEPQRTQLVTEALLQYTEKRLDQTKKDLRALKAGGGTYLNPPAGKSCEDRVEHIEGVVEEVLQYIEKSLDQIQSDLKKMKGIGGKHQATAEPAERILDDFRQYAERTLEQAQKHLKALKGSGGTYVKATAGQDLEQRMERIERVIEEVLGYVEQAVKGIKQQGEKILKKSLPGAPS